MTIDLLAAEELACFGGTPGAGASLCAFAEDGTLFEWAAANHQGEAPAIATALTGLPAYQHGVSAAGQSFLRSEHRSIAEILSAAGYRTAAFVASPRLNRSRRLDQGFDRYDDAISKNGDSTTHLSIDLSARIQHWLATNAAPRFLWIHADREAGLAELDRLLSRLSPVLDQGDDRAGFLFAALQGEANLAQTDRIDWLSHRIPLFWRPPGPPNENVPHSFALAGLDDILPTLISAARAPGSAFENEEDGDEAHPGLISPFAGRDLNRLIRAPLEPGVSANRFILLRTPDPAGEVGLASARHLYSRGLSPLDGTGQPVPTQVLADHGARFAEIPIPDPARGATRSGAALIPNAWREDILDAQSPVPRLEVHLARRLAAILAADAKENR